MSAYRYIGVDLETTGTTHEKHVPIQIGVAVIGSDGIPWVFDRLIGGWDWRQFEWTTESEAIHGITPFQVDNAQSYREVDHHLEEWLKMLVPTGTRIMVGWNVGSFDRPYIERWLPKTSALFIRRTLDLNACCYLLDAPGTRNPDTLKKQAKAYADDLMMERWTEPERARRHDASYDAECALYELEYLRRML